MSKDIQNIISYRIWDLQHISKSGAEVVKDTHRCIDKHFYNEQDLLLLNLIDISKGKSRYKIKYFMYNFQGE